MRVSSPQVASVVSGVVWAAIAYLLEGAIFDWIIWGGVIAAPVIGLLVGRISRGFGQYGRLGQAGMALLSLYIATAAFGVAMALVPMVGPKGLYWPGTVPEVVFAIWWGITVTKLFLFLWPLAWVNHAIVSRLWSSVDGVHPVK